MDRLQISRYRKNTKSQSVIYNFNQTSQFIEIIQLSVLTFSCDAALMRRFMRADLLSVLAPSRQLQPPRRLTAILCYNKHIGPRISKFSPMTIA